MTTQARGDKEIQSRFSLGGASAWLAGDLDLRYVVTLLWRRRWLIAGAVLLMVGLTWLVLTRVTPVYTATAKVMIETRRPTVIDSKEVVSRMVPQFFTVMSEVEVIRSRNLVKRVARALDLYADPEFNPRLRQAAALPGLLATVRDWVTETMALVWSEPPAPQLSPEEEKLAVETAVEEGLLGRIGVRSIPQSLVIEIAVSSPDRQKAARIANSVAEQYVLDQLEAKFDATRQAAVWLNSRLDELRQRVVESERAVAAYRAEAGLIESRGQFSSQQQISELTSQLILAQAKRSEVESRVNRLELMAKTSARDTGDEALDSPLIQRLKEQEALLSREASELGMRYEEKHPRVVKVRAELSEIQSKITAEINKVSQALRNELQVLRGRERGLSDQIKRNETVLTSQSKAEVRLRELEREAQANKLVFESFLNRFKETSEQERIQQPDARIISRAEAPRAPSYPRRLMLLAAAGLIGLVLGIVVTFLLERLNGTYRGREQLEAATGLPAIGTVPQIRRRIGKGTEDYLVDRPASGYAEAFRSVWLTLRHATPDAGKLVVLVTSSLPDEGKSLTALSLARTVAQLGARTVLVECDLRRPSLVRMLGLDVSRPVNDVLADAEMPYADACIRDTRTTLDILPAQAVKGSPFDLLESAAMTKLIRRLRDDYDLVVIDTPPVLPVSDAKILMPMADRVLFCVRWDRTPREVVSAALRSLRDVGPGFVGLLLTRVNLKRQSRYGYGEAGGHYSRYKAYYAD